MTDLHDTLADRMRQAAADVDAPTLELVARGIRRGKVLRRRRAVLAGLSGAFAVLAVVAGGTQLLQHTASGDVAPASTRTTAPVHPRPRGPLATLAELLPAGVHVSGGTTTDGILTAMLHDGRGATMLTLSLMTVEPNTSCNGSPPGTCKVEPDGTVYVAYNLPVFPYEKHPYGVRVATVELFYPDGRQISISNYNAPKDDGVEHTRPQPILSVAQLTQIARSKLWVYPPD
ncbi:hypothetical protein AB0E69_24350 [Kribbella sp. NPDC026611]|uniref:hypothetical protein n=1 Tax=Kribbella sp. NPDC026611 TaxID=3154911 RepID=UPI0033EF8495